MIASPNHSSRGGATVRLIVIHTAEGALTTKALGNYFANAATEVSSHVGIDDEGTEQYVDYSQESWSVRSANPISDDAELCGFAAWSRGTWINDHMPMLHNAAAWISERCAARGIPCVHLTTAQVAAGKPGVIGHVDWTNAMHDGTHTDPGQNFPWDVVMALATGTTPAAASHHGDDPMTAVPINVLPDGTFHETVMAESGGGSQVVAQAWLDIGSTWGTSLFRITGIGSYGVVPLWPAKTPPGQLASVPNNGYVAGIVLPAGTNMVTIEGKVANPKASPATRPAASVASLPR